MIPTRELSELEQIEAQANAILADAQRQRSDTIPTLENCRRERAHARQRLEACKQLVESWQKIEKRFENLENTSIDVLAKAERVIGSARRTIDLVNSTLTMNHEPTAAKRRDESTT